MNWKKKLNDYLTYIVVHCRLTSFTNHSWFVEQGSKASDVANGSLVHVYIDQWFKLHGTQNAQDSNHKLHALENMTQTF